VIELGVADGVHRVSDAFVNWYLVEEDGRFVAVDAGLPASWDLLGEALGRLGRSRSDLEAVVVTHAHFDHVGFAERARRELNVPVYLHPGDEAIRRHPRRYPSERSPLLYANRTALRMYATVARSGALWAPKIGAVSELVDGEALPLPGNPVAIHTPGHTPGHCSIHLPDRGVAIAGDALVTLDPYTGREGPRLVARGATADSARARASLERLAATGASVVLPGHGEPWREGAAAAAEAARRAEIG
jgi:glyoxylase-like metal-dependent hydrolase (beta-lactamase superfamily II)